MLVPPISCHVCPVRQACTLPSPARARLSIDEAMGTEFRIVSRVCRGKDFYEGIRATILDKDSSPHWGHTNMEAIAQEEVDAYFAPLPEGELTFDSRRTCETVL